MKNWVVSSFLLVGTTGAFQHFHSTRRNEGRSSRESFLVSTSKIKSSTQLYYFDDISRRRPLTSWTPEIMDQINFAKLPTDVDTSQSYGAEKMVYLQKLLNNEYNAETALNLGNEQVQLILETWMEDHDFDNDLKISNHEILICDAKNIFECIAFLWDFVDNHKQGNDELTMILFPYCQDMYTFQNLELVWGCIESCYENCTLLGKDYVISCFHHNYKNQPKMLSPLRHTPFPCFGVHSRNLLENESIESIVDDLSSISLFGVPEDEESVPNKNTEIDSILSDMKQIGNDKQKLEKLFNAASYNSMSIALNDENDDSKIKSLTMEWMKKYSVREEFHSVNWSFSRCNNPEQLYYDVWNTIAKIIEKEDPSAIFVAPQFSTTNAQAFKRIAVSINKALRKLSFCTGINIQISELYHPEFVSKQSSMSHKRRSPFPTLEVDFECEE